MNLSGSFVFPFVHTEWLVVAAIAAIATSVFLPRARWRLWASLAIGAAVASAGALAGFIEWRGEMHFAAYGVLLLLGFTAAYGLMFRRARTIGIPERYVLDMFMIAIVAGMIGARARYVWERPHEFTRDPAGGERSWSAVVALAVDFDRGGMVWYGGMVLATLGILAYAWWRRLRILALGDIVAPALLLGLGVGRIGCFLNGCCYGHPTDVAWAVTIQHDGRVEHVHPTQLYETIACVTMSVGLWAFWKHRRVDGQVLCLGTMGYGIWRFINEILRGDDKIPSNLLGLPDPHGHIDTSQATSLQLAVGAVVVAVLVHVYRMRHPEAAIAAAQVPGSTHAPPRPTPVVAPAAGLT